MAALHVVVLLVLLWTGGALWNPSSIRPLVNDEISRAHQRTAITIGYWLAIAVAMILFLVPRVWTLTLREAVYLIVTPNIAAALFVFSYLEYRAHRDG